MVEDGDISAWWQWLGFTLLLIVGVGMGLIVVRWLWETIIWGIR